VIFLFTTIPSNTADDDKVESWKSAPIASGLSFRVVMGQRPTHRNESQDVTPAKAGAHVREELDSRFRGNDVTFDGAQRGISLCFDGWGKESERDSLLL
jgi:hypothetical protein